MKARRFAAWLSLAALVAVPVARAQTATAAPERLVVVTASGPHVYSVEVAQTPAEQERGLMFRRDMAADRGMIFPFAPPQPVQFWMHDTYIALDMLFVGADGRIAAIKKDATPLSDAIIPSGVAVAAVVELDAGQADAIGAKVGDRVSDEVVFTAP